MIRVFPKRKRGLSWIPKDDLSFIGDPPLFLPPEQPVAISVVFTWDIKEGERLQRAWSKHYSDVRIGGPAFNDSGEEFEPGRFIKQGVTITWGCPYSCPWCFVPAREGDLRELQIRDGHIIQDNNFLACSQSHVEKVFEMLSHQDKPADFAGGLDAKLLTKWHVNLLKQIPINQMWFSCDTIDALSGIERIAKLLEDFSLVKKRCYVLVGFDGESMDEAEARLLRILELGFLPFAMLYKAMDSEVKNKKEWRNFLKYWCRPAAYRSKKIESYRDL